MIVAISAMITVLAVRRERPSWPHLAVILMMLAGALVSARNAPLFGMVAVPLLALEIDPQWRAVGLRWFAHLRTVFDEGERIAVRGRWAPWVAGALIVLALNHGAIAGTPIVKGEFDSRSVPVDAVQHAREAGLRGRMFNNFVWGGYLIWEWPEQKIFIDGMTDFLGNDVMAAYIEVASLDPGWQETLQRYDVSVILMPPGSRLVYALRQRPEWHVWYEDDVAIILTRGEPVLAGPVQ
jgi:hypothetical protein